MEINRKNIKYVLSHAYKTETSSRAVGPNPYTNYYLTAYVSWYFVQLDAVGRIIA